MDTKTALHYMQRCDVRTFFMLDDICRKYHITYFLAYGALIGAVRHGGFIPWDDDIDLIMPRDDLNRLMGILEKELPEPYVLNHYQEKEFSTGSFVLKVCDPRIQFTNCMDGEDKVFDSFVSIFPMDGAPKGRLVRFFFEKKIDLYYVMLRFVRSAHNGTVNQAGRSTKEKIGIALNRLFHIGDRTDVRTITKKMDENLQKYAINTSDSVSTYGFRITPFYYRKECFDKVVFLPYEGRKVMVPVGYDELLRIWYGDYMTLPPEEKRQPAHGLHILVNDPSGLEETAEAERV